MEWKKIGYLKLVVAHSVEIDMTNYPTDELQAPMDSKQDHLIRVLCGWKDGSIKWIKLSDEVVTRRRETLERLIKEREDQEMWAYWPFYGNRPYWDTVILSPLESVSNVADGSQIGMVAAQVNQPATSSAGNTHTNQQSRYVASILMPIG